jgi:hypothetical protein
MELRTDARIPFPRDIVFAAYRDHIAELVPYLPNVRRIDVQSRHEEGPVVQLVNEWHGGGELPAGLRAVVGDSMLSWIDRAAWNSETFRCDWRSETRAFAEALRCAGCNAFVEDGPGKTLLQIRGTIDVDAKKIRGVPGFLAGKVGRTIEEFLGSRIETNLVETASGLAKYLETRKQPQSFI